MHETTDATRIFAPLWRRKWLILAVGLVVAAASYLYYKHQRATYEASTQVYLGSSAEEAAAGEKSARTSSSEVVNDAAIINSIVVEEVRHKLRTQHKGALVRHATVRATAKEKSLFITITAEAHRAKGSELLANAVAQAYVQRRNLDRESSIDKAINVARRQLTRIEASEAPVTSPSTSSSTSKGKGAASSLQSTSAIIQAANLSSKINQLETSRGVGAAQQVKRATTAELLSPQPRQDAIFGFAIGIVLASMAAYALSRFDKRLRTLAEIESIFGSQILAALPKTERPVVRRTGQPAPSRSLLEPLRRLHTMLNLGTGVDEQGAKRRTILFLSPDAGDGKSTLVADLALVQRDGGERVTIVEANFRRPVQARLLGLGDGHGLAEVLTGARSIEDAAQRVTPLPTVDDGASLDGPAGAGATALATRSLGSLFLLAGSRTAANPPALLADDAIADVMHSLGQECDYVLVDAPSPLEFSDVMPLLRLVDGIVLVARAGHTREHSAQRFMQLIGTSSTAPILGTVVNCVSKADLARHGSSAGRRDSWLGKLIRS